MLRVGSNTFGREPPSLGVVGFESEVRYIAIPPLPNLCFLIGAPPNARSVEFAWSRTPRSKQQAHLQVPALWVRRNPRIAPKLASSLRITIGSVSEVSH